MADLKKLYDALTTIKIECATHEKCGTCPFYTRVHSNYCGLYELGEKVIAVPPSEYTFRFFD